MDIEIKEQEKQRVQKDESVRLEITLSKSQFQKLSRCKDLTAHLLEQNRKDSSWVSVIEVLSDQYLNKKEIASSSRRSPSKGDATAKPKSEVQTKEAPQAEPKMESRSESKVTTDAQSKTNLRTGPEAKLKTKSTAASETESVNKSLTPKVRLKILDRDQCCQFKDPLTGRQCRSTFKLQIDHRTSQWAGGNHARDNLQVFCKMHNQLKYRKEAQLRFV